MHYDPLLAENCAYLKRQTNKQFTCEVVVERLWVSYTSKLIGRDLHTLSKALKRTAMHSICSKLKVKTSE